MYIDLIVLDVTLPDGNGFDFFDNTLKNKDMGFSYRHSICPEKGYIVLKVKLILEHGTKEDILALIEDRKRRRIESQPLEYPSAGSVFRNPENDFAGRLIEELGYKGFVNKGAKVSEKHANFIVNHDNAKAEDIKEIIEKLQKEVKEKYNIELKCEQEFVNWE